MNDHEIQLCRDAALVRKPEADLTDEELGRAGSLMHLIMVIAFRLDWTAAHESARVEKDRLTRILVTRGTKRALDDAAK